jgi:NTP pyrophosphatase (non-canonical NTP hydrolase)
MTLDFDKYQEDSSLTAIYPGSGELLGLTYVTLGLCSEAGEIAGKVKKIIRDDDGQINQAKADALAAEVGDVLWYVAQLAEELNRRLNGIAEENLDKLNSRKERGVIGGSGDTR